MGAPLPDKIYRERSATRYGLTLQRGPDPRYAISPLNNPPIYFVRHTKHPLLMPYQVIQLGRRRDKCAHARSSWPRSLTQGAATLSQRRSSISIIVADVLWVLFLPRWRSLFCFPLSCYTYSQFSAPSQV